MRSRAVFLPLACCFSIAASPLRRDRLVVAHLEVGELACGRGQIGGVSHPNTVPAHENLIRWSSPRCDSIPPLDEWGAARDAGGARLPGGGHARPDGGPRPAGTHLDGAARHGARGECAASRSSFRLAPTACGRCNGRSTRALVPGGVALRRPNDILIGDKKVCGILAEVAADGRVVLGAGVNLTMTAAQLPVPTATSLTLEGADSAGLARTRCSTPISRGCSVTEGAQERGPHAAPRSGARCGWSSPGAAELIGEAVGIDDEGRLQVRDGRGVTRGSGPVTCTTCVTPRTGRVRACDSRSSVAGTSVPSTPLVWRTSATRWWRWISTRRRSRRSPPVGRRSSSPAWMRCSPARSRPAG